MKNPILADYEKHLALSEAYDLAITKGEKEAVRAAHFDLMTEIDSKGETYCLVYRLYSKSRSCGNSDIDISEPHEYRNVEKLVEALRTFGFERFTFSSGWSSAVETAWAFTRQGCTLVGMTEVFSDSLDREDNRKRNPAYVFSLC